MRILAISAGVGQPSSTRMLIDRMVDSVRSQSDAEVTAVDLRDYGQDLMNAALTGVSSPRVRELLDHVARADGVITASPIMNASYSGLFKLFWDVLEEGSLRGKPILLGATGGTARHSLAIDQAMVPLFHYLRAITVPTSVFVATGDWGSPAGLDERIRDAVGQFVALLGGVPETSAGKKAYRIEDDFRLAKDFEQLMREI